MKSYCPYRLYLFMITASSSADIFNTDCTLRHDTQEVEANPFVFPTVRAVMIAEIPNQIIFPFLRCDCLSDSRSSPLDLYADPVVVGLNSNITPDHTSRQQYKQCLPQKDLLDIKDLLV